MKIQSARVIDPRKDDDLSPPYLVVNVDEEPTELGRSLTVSSSGPQLKFTQYGPFWSIDPLSDHTFLEEEVAGFANHAAPTRLDKVVPVEVCWSDEYRSMFLPVQRARTLLRKNKQPYRYTVSDVAARHGRIQWDLESHPMMCMFYLPGSGICADDRISDIINLHHTQMPVCRLHAPVLRNMARNLRLQRSNA